MNVPVKVVCCCYVLKVLASNQHWLTSQCYSVLFTLVVDPDDPYKLTEDTRQLGLVVCRGTSVVLICPADGMEAIANPFLTQDS